MIINDAQYNLLMEQKSVISSIKNWGMDLSEKEFIKGMSIINPQSYGTKIQNRIQNELGYNKIKASENCGDIRSICKNNVEVKVSILTPQNNMLNMVQIRLFHDVDYYLCVAYDCRNISKYKKYIFLLTHDEMKLECASACAAHGTTEVNKLNNNVELRMSIICEENEIKFIKWKNQYLINSFEEVDECIQKK